MSTLLFTPAALLDFLSQVDELSEYELSISELDSGGLFVQIGESSYHLNNDSIVDVSAPARTVEEVEDLNESTLSDLEDSGDVELVPVESGIIKQLAKTLLVGGVVRLAAKLLK